MTGWISLLLLALGAALVMFGMWDSASSYGNARMGGHYLFLAGFGLLFAGIIVGIVWAVTA